MNPKQPTGNQYPDTPSVIQIETTILCNAKCWFCPQNNTLRQPNYMEEQVWKKIIDESRGMGVTYRPFLLNEPFFDKRMPDIMRYIRQDPTARIEFNSNGSVVHPKLADEVISIGIDTIRFSVDGFKRETFDESRGLSYDNVYRNVEYFLKRVKETGAKTHTEVRMIRFPGTEEEQVDFKKYWEERGPDNVILTDLYRYPWEGQTEAVNLPCLKVEREMFFYVDGTATLCCWDSTGRQLVGDIRKQTLIDIWKGQELARCRSLLDKGRRDELNLCKRCDAYTSTDFSKWATPIEPFPAAGTPAKKTAQGG
ncbi:MAG: radical SAM protein [Deltaproteobacteria bacterium]|nr:radical SAM protein [Deltaproteobacteria bacterium]